MQGKRDNGERVADFGLLMIIYVVRLILERETLVVIIIHHQSLFVNIAS